MAHDSLVQDLSEDDLRQTVTEGELDRTLVWDRVAVFWSHTARASAWAITS